MPQARPHADAAELLDERAYQRRLADAVAQALAGHESAPQALADLLGISRAVAYKRLRSETHFTAREVAILREAFDLVVSPYDGGAAGEALLFRTRERRRGLAFDADAYLGLLAEGQARLADLPAGHKPTIRAASSDLPIFYYFTEPALAALKLYGFSVAAHRGRERLPAFGAFRDAHARHAERAAAYAEAYLAIPAVEVWSRSPIEHTLRQIVRFAELGLVEEEADLAELFAALRRVLGRLGDALERGRHTGGGSLAVLCNELHYTNSIILVAAEGGEAGAPPRGTLYVTFDNPHFLVSEQAEAVAFFARHFARLVAMSEPVTRLGQISARRYVGQQLTRIDAAERRARLVLEARGVDWE